ncbi:PEP-CTERM sorting domain-containing protein [Candidatus Gracilibacteria bacterium]|jgi:hypothetical protein|nr:PEP-CTERM sorting domain-containing protein [Candidatus Gracilibacteria bacterium]NJM90612.1 PEP-CTERM sorting domain-containing protein [Hydrococcus sp. RU_2_2]NJP22436.1 PEP-CTERM sorting domain-containing protein [Hydrococcus sp. CRU_1_1]NJQ98555.1 PEP-CTERM sorting domain-containing protein [Hydrococcus sp. CSU_1_8]
MFLLSRSFSTVAIATIAILGTTIGWSQRSLAGDMTFGDSGEKSVPELLNAHNISGGKWMNLPTFELPKGDIEFTLLEEIAGNSKKNTFGIFDVATKKTLTIFSGSAKSGDKTTLKVSGNTLSVGGSSVTLGGNEFGLFLKGPGGQFFSDSSSNFATYKNGVDAVLALEDLNWFTSDKDHNDMMILAAGLFPLDTSSDITEIPEPSSLFGLGLLVSSLALYRRRQSTQG